MAAGAAETITRTLSRARWPVLIALALVTAIAIFELLRSQSLQTEVTLRVLAVVLAVAAIAFIHLRHLGLAALVAIAPLPGLLAVIAVTGETFLAEANYAFGLTIALFAADVFAVRVLDGAPPAAATFETFEDFGAAALAIFVVASLVPLILHWRMADTPWSAFGASASVLAAGLVVPLGASALKYGETFVTGFNRMREKEERLVTPLLPVAHVRWGASVAGVALVICALGYFGSAGLIFQQSWLVIMFAAALCAAAAFSVTRDWRRAGAVILSIVPAVMVALWAMARMHETLGELALDTAAIVFLGGFALVLFVAAQASRYRRAGDDTGLASARAMERKSAIAIAAALASAITIAVATPNPVALIILLVFSTIAAVLFQPAIAIAVETLFPRRETIEARYRVR